MKKPYDMLEWGFIDKALEAWGFDSYFCAFILRCVKAVEF